MHYDEASGVLTSMEVSGVGTFTAAYDADGNLIERGLPNGLTAKTTYNQAGEPTRLAYTKTSFCGESCTWYEESLERSIEGQILNGTSSLVEDRYSYDKAGRLTEAQETPAEGLPEEGGCTSRKYTYDADSNRLSKKIQTVKAGLPCAISEGETQSYNYDEADRLEGPSYDAWGRITTLPAGFAGGKELKTTYFANDMVATQEQDGVTNTFQLDSTGRQRRREQTGGVASVEVFHYDGPGDSPSWTSLGSTWSRSIPGIGGELAAIQEGGGGTTTTTFKLTDLHGDAVASASSSPTATKLLATFRFSEFGEPEGSSSAGRFGWLGDNLRRTELSSGVIQMGARSYIPSLGRFLTPDSIRGGSANAYDYADQDPVNVLDLTGESAKKKKRRTPAGTGGGTTHKPKKPLIPKHNLHVHATAGNGIINVAIDFHARVKVTVRAFVTFRGSAGPISGVTAQDEVFGVSGTYKGPASTGELAKVCLTATAGEASEFHCYNTPITTGPRGIPLPETVPESPLIPIPIVGPIPVPVVV